MPNRLQSIFDCYKKEYKFKTTLFLERSCICIFNYRKNYIIYDIKWIKDKTIIGYAPKSIKEKIIFCLLHEIKHAIDWKYNTKLMERELLEMDNYSYQRNSNYSFNLPFEKRAHKFAKKEIKKWIKC